jgi:hypothetical protein
LLSNFPATFEDDEGRDAADSVRNRWRRIGLGVELEGENIAGPFPRHLIDDRSGNPAGLAPGRPEVHQHWNR